MMRRNTRSIARHAGGMGVALLVALAAARGYAADAVTLKPEAYVKGPTVLLGDVAEVTGENAEALASITVGTAAVPGGIKRLDAALLAARIKNAGFSDNDVHIIGPTSVVAKTLRVELTKEMIAEDLRRFIQTKVPWEPDDTLIDIIPPSQDIAAPDGELSINWMPAAQYRFLGPGVFRGDIKVDGTLCRTISCQVNIAAYAPVIVTTTDIPRGKVIAASDVALEKRPLAPNAVDSAQSLDEVVGFAAKSTLLPGQVISTRHLLPKQVIKRNQTVIVEAQSGGLVVRARARAMTDGREGDVVSCQNMESKEEFTGIARADGVVAVP
ncbi:MAG TPA: flagellar basal body P-ring formation chaperone FlgA [Candidatus Hydrogenedentes bacterium]|nr:flagellar basal body P-ring formation chaperone FlgA [Candidatus Hydrogenedentota bacterium]